MTTATLPRLAGPSERASGLFRFLATVVAGVIEAREIATRYDHLARLSNSELTQLGLTRQDIPRAAVFGVPAI